MIYIHIPYCKSFCTYCDFYSEIPNGGFEAFVNALCSEITARGEGIPWDYNTLYIGGGTPSVLPLGVLRRVVETLGVSRSGSCTAGSDDEDGGRMELPHFDEFTIEVNPDDVVRLGVEYVRGLAELGVNRISMGVQSLDDRVLKWMNRRHSATAAREAYRIIREGGIDNISVDLIFGIGDICAVRSDGGVPSAADFPSSCAKERFDSTETLLKTLDEFLNLGGDGVPPRHISAYQFSIEPGSELAEMVERGEYVPASDEVCARQYEILCGRLGSAGYRHYEISNFALPSFEARHNSAYWCHIPYIGFGPAAHSFFIVENSALGEKDCLSGGVAVGSENLVSRAKYIRRWNRPDLCAYLKAAETGDWDSVSEGEVLTDEQIREERIMLALRTDLGIPATELSNVEKFVGEGLLEVISDGSEKRLRIPESKFFVSDGIISDLF